MKKYCLFPVALLLRTMLIATPAPDFTVTTSDGQVRQLYQDYVNQQKVVVLEIFFTTCPPCAAHAPHLQTLYSTAKTAYPNQVEFILLSDKNADNNLIVANYLTSKGLTMPAAGSNGGSLTAVQPYKNGAFGTFLGTPTFVVIAPGTGEVVFDIRGNSPQETMSLIGQKIADLLPKDCFLESYFGNPIEDVEITVDAPAFDTAFVASGSYSLSGVAALQGASYTITPFKNDDPLQGLSTFDLLLISKHILGLTPFVQPWQLLAADMNCSGSVTGLDIVAGRKVILGINNEFSGCASNWRFVPEPASTPTNGDCLNFRGVKIGDVVGPYFAPNDPVDDRGRKYLFCNNARLKSGQTYQVHIYADADFNLSGFQLAFGIAPSRLRIRRIESFVLQGFNEENYNLGRQSVEGFAPVSWTSAERPVPVSAGVVLLTLEVEVLQGGLLCDMLGLRHQLRAEGYGEAGDIQPLELIWREALPSASNTISIVPNPAHDVFFIAFNAEREEEYLVQIIDTQGKIVFEKTVSAAKGDNNREIRPPTPLSGWHFVKINGQVARRILFEKRD